MRGFREKHKIFVADRSRRKHIYNVDDSKVYVSWNELLYDLIFIIVLDKLTEIFVNTSNINIPFLFMVVSTFIIMFMLWFKRVLRMNHLYILENKRDIKMPQYKFLTYIEMLCLLVLFYKLDYFNIEFYIILMVVFFIFEFVSLHSTRSIITEHHNNEFDEILKTVQTFWNIRSNSLNVGHLLERFGVLIILFLGELLHEVFVIDVNIIILIMSCITIFSFFDNNVRIIENIEEETSKYSVIDYALISGYFRNTLVFLLLILLTINYSHHNEIAYPIALIVIVIINKFNQLYTLYNLSDKWLQKEETFCFIYFIFSFTYVLCVKNYNLLMLIIVVLFPVFELLKKNRYNQREML